MLSQQKRLRHEALSYVGAPTDAVCWFHLSMCVHMFVSRLSWSTPVVSACRVYLCGGRGPRVSDALQVDSLKKSLADASRQLSAQSRHLQQQVSVIRQHMHC